MRCHSGGKLSQPLPVVFVLCLLGGHPQFIHYLESCSSYAWVVTPDSTFLYSSEKKREWELTGVYFNELCVCLTSFPHLLIPTWKRAEVRIKKLDLAQCVFAWVFSEQAKVPWVSVFQRKFKHAKEGPRYKRKRDKKWHGAISSLMSFALLSWPHLRVSGG